MGINNKIDGFEKMLKKGEELLNRVSGSAGTAEGDPNIVTRDPQAQLKRASEMRQKTTSSGSGSGIRFCTNCGQKLREGVAFCSGCGAKVSQKKKQSGESGEARQLRSKTTTKKKEPEKKGFFATLLDALDEEEISDKVAKDPADLEEYYASVSADWEKVKLVQNCIIPEDEDKLRKLVLLCEEHIPDTSKEYIQRESYEVEAAWMGKLEQIFERTRRTIPDKPLFQTIEAVYFEKQQEYKKKNGTARKAGSWISKHTTELALAGLLIGMFIIIGIVMKISSDEEEEAAKRTAQFNEKLAAIQEKIDAGDLDGAMNRVEILSTENELQRKKKQELLNSILVLQGKTEGMLLIPEISSSTNYVDAVTKLEYLGFTNVSAEAADVGLFEKYVQKAGEYFGEYKDGCVLEISVNGAREYLDGLNHDDGEYVVGTYAAPDAKIVIRYKEGD